MSQRRIKQIPHKQNQVIMLTPDDFAFNKLEWSEQYSPLRLSFRNSDPARRGRGLYVAEHDRAQIDTLAERSQSTPGVVYTTDFRKMITVIENVPLSGATSMPNFVYSIRLSWINTAHLLVQGLERGICPYFDAEHQWMISGYELLSAGLVMSDCNIPIPSELSDVENQDRISIVGSILTNYSENLQLQFPDDPNIGRADAWLFKFMSERGRISPENVSVYDLGVQTSAS